MIRSIGSFLITLLVVFVLVAMQAPAEAKKAPKKAAPTRLFTVPFTHVANNEQIATVLVEFARIQGYRAVVSPQLNGTINGSFEMIDPYAFLQSMQAAYQVQWYYQNHTINFFSQSELQQAFLTPSVVNAKTLYSLFREAGILSPNLSHKLLQGNQVLFVTGPGYYIDQLRQAMLSFEQAQSNRVTMRVFPLKHAWAEDKQVNSSSNTQVTIPGIATILRGIVSGGTGQSVVTTSPSVQQGLLGHGLGAKPEKGEGKRGKSEQGPVNIVADPRMNAVVVTDAEYRMDYYARVIADLDKPLRLVEIHAAIVDIDSNFQRELGINFQGAAELGNGWRLGGAGGASAVQGTLPSVGAASDSGLSFSTLYTRGTDFFLTRVNALEKDGVARMLGKPSVLTTDNVMATLENTSTYYIPISGYQASDLYRVETGTVLKVTPHIIPGRRLPDATLLPDAIKLIVTVEDNQDSGTQTFTVSGTNPQPLRQTKINTQAIVNEGQSLLIAGYYHETQSDTTSGIPGVKNIPLIGRLFQTKSKEHVRMERLILITPRILDIDDLPLVPKRVDDPRFSQAPDAATFEERVPKAQPVGGCTRRRLDYASTPDYPADKGKPEHPVPMGEPATPLKSVGEHP